jgi:hypothetical protein
MRRQYQFNQLEICFTVTVYNVNTCTALITKLAVEVHLLEAKFLHETQNKV